MARLMPSWQVCHWLPRGWMQANVPDNFFVVCGDRHWQYVSQDKATGIEEWSVGAATDAHAGGWSEKTPRPEHRFLRTGHGGFFSGEVQPSAAGATLALRLHATDGTVVFESVKSSAR